MNLAALRTLIWGVIAAASLAACGGATDDSGVASGGTGGTGISYGSVTGFGSVIVNGVEFDTASATVIVNGQPGPDEATDAHRGLAEGMVVRVEGTIDPSGTTGMATRVTYSDNLEGPISRDPVIIDANTRQVTVLGQTVLVDSQTVFQGSRLADLAAGNVIEVSGFIDEQGRIHATYVELKATELQPGMEIEIKGSVSVLTALTFNIGSLVVNYASAELPPGGLATGLFVEVKGERVEGNALFATKIELEMEGIGDSDADEAEIEGFVTAVNGPGDFVIGNQRFVTTGSTSFKGGLLTDILVGVKLEVEGMLTNGVLTAEEVEFRDSIKLESAVAAVNMDDSFTLKGLPDIAVRWNDVTRVEGFASASAIRADDLVKVRARIVGGELVATAIEAGELDPEKTKVELQGPVDSIAGSVLVILGVPIDTAAITEFFDADENPVTRTQFFAALTVGALVEVEGELGPDGTTVLWDETELED